MTKIEDNQTYFVLDANVLLHNASAIDSFANSCVVLSLSVLERLNKYKSSNVDHVRNAMTTIRRVDNYREKHKGNGHSLSTGVPLENGGVLLVYFNYNSIEVPGINSGRPEYQVLSTAYALKCQGKKVVFVSRDINARLKADFLGIEVSDFQNQKVCSAETYSGQQSFLVEENEVARFNNGGKSIIEGDERFVGLMPNEFATLVSNSNPEFMSIGRFKNGVFSRLEKKRIWNLRTGSIEQQMAIELLLDYDVSLMTMAGGPGVGKTLMALATGLTLVKKGAYKKILVLRPVISLGKELGYLPGKKGEKVFPWMQPIRDNLAVLMNGQNQDESYQHVLEKINELETKGIIEYDVLTRMRGRSIHDAFVIVDEAQNMKPGEAKTMVSRAGEGTKIILMGDPSQIDHPDLDSLNNGLLHVVDRMRTLSFFGHTTLLKSMRGDLSQAASEYM